MRMPAVLLLVLLMMLMTAPVSWAGQVDSGRHKAELETLLDEFMAGASVSDAAMHDRFWSEELIYTSSSGMRFGKQQIMDSLASADAGESPAISYRAEDVTTRIYGDVAVITFQLVGEGPESVSRFFNTGTFLYSNQEWRAVAWQATRIPEPTVAD